MKHRKYLITWIAVEACICPLLLLSTLLLVDSINGAIVPPPWSNPAKNPCATLPGGWQLLYWAPLKKCFKIFTIGYPCPETMELSPTALHGAKRKGEVLNTPAAECRCPPGTALSVTTNKCHNIYQRGPCKAGEYFRPQTELGSASREHQRWGMCEKTDECPTGMIYWPNDGKCYTKYTKGPCLKGKLIISNEDGLGECNCFDEGHLKNYYYEPEGTCHEHFTKGPCPTPGHIFLPGGQCDCRRSLPHYHEQSQMCYQLDTLGPCPPGHIYTLSDYDSNTDMEFDLLPHAKCQCKDGYVPWHDGNCYRLYTRGPCAEHEFLINATTCVHNFCGKSKLYFPTQGTCYRIGTQGPCALNQVVVFDFTARPSIDGISYNGMCGCSGIITNLDQKCDSNDQDQTVNTCESTPTMVEINGNCYKLYTRGPCGPGQWLEPVKSHIQDEQLRSFNRKAKCVCRPGFTYNKDDEQHYIESTVEILDHNNGMNIQRCNAPSVGLARYLTTHQQQQRQNAKYPNDYKTFLNFKY